MACLFTVVNPTSSNNIAYSLPTAAATAAAAATTASAAAPAAPAAVVATADGVEEQETGEAPVQPLGDSTNTTAGAAAGAGVGAEVVVVEAVARPAPTSEEGGGAVKRPKKKRKKEAAVGSVRQFSFCFGVLLQLMSIIASNTDLANLRNGSVLIQKPVYV